MKAPAEFYACIYVKEFPAQAALRLRPEMRQTPCAILDGDPPLESVCSLNARARAAGAEHGMTRSEAETIPTLNLLTRSRREESSAATALLEAGAAFTPRIENRSTDQVFACLLDITGTERLFGAPPKLAHSLHRRLRAIGISACIATSSNAHAAIALAKGLSLRSPVLTIASGQQRAALARLPLSVLDLTQDQAETLTLWGIRTLGSLTELPENELISRMGKDGARLRQLARGELPHLFQPIQQVFSLEEHIELETPVELLDSLLFVVGRMLEQLIVRASANLVALTSATIELQLDNKTIHTRKVQPALPTNDRALWLKLLHLDLETHPPHASIVAVTLTTEHGNTRNVQLGLFSPQLPEPANLDVTLARIAKIVGENCVGRAVLRDSHQPDSFLVEKFEVTETSPTIAPAKQAGCAARQLRPSENVSITFACRRPGHLRFRDQQYTVERAYGPWLSGGEWWNANLWNAEQWDIVARRSDGTLLCGCIVRDLLHDRWQMVALYD